jgi:nucleoside-diphosphate-sugar epimerase
MMEAAGLVGEITLKPSPAGSVCRRAPKLEKLKRLTGYRPRVSLREGLRETAKFYLD